ncbi:MAG: hypothetical protein ACKO0U_04550 [Gammaproteobacteria bacterium]
MSDSPERTAREPTFSADDLYREDTYTDRRIGTIRVLTPVLPSGERDPAREIEFSGQISVMTPMGALPVGFELPGPTLADATAAFTEAAKAGIERTMEEIAQMRREAASSLVIPGQGGGMGGMGGLGGLGGGGLDGGGLGGGGRLRMP